MKRILINIILGLVSLSLMESCKEKDSNSNIQANDYQEKHRPQFHFSPNAKWMNDPNGMVYFEGEYHLFYQCYPFATVWGPMHWGHAISTDLVHWQQMPIALFPDSIGYIFSGSAVIDYNNTSGLGEAGKPAMVAIYTYHNIDGEKAGRIDFQTQGIAFSLDKGRTWVKYTGNPVLKNPGQKDFRDPKVCWNTETNKWIMTLASGDHVCFYSSPNLKEWSLESEFGKNLGAHGGVWECPDLIEMTVDNGEKKWVLLVSINPGGPNGGSATQYFTGTFNGVEFVPDNTETRWVDYGKDNYAGVTFSNIPANDGRIINIGWMSNWQYAQNVPTVKWRSAMTFPREMSLIRQNGVYQLISLPVDNIQLLRESKSEIESHTISASNTQSSKAIELSGQCEINLKYSIPANSSATEFGLELYNSMGEQLIIGYDRIKSNIFINRNKAGKNEFSGDFGGIHTAPFTLTDSALDVKLLIDKASIELFVKQGELVMTEIFFPSEDFTKAKFFSNNGEVILISGVYYHLTPIWKNQ